ncbi:MAG: hypothetical protein FWB71_02855 [Defluviitaleaceae bacterium]|nr:hypothetical protein [Defluviitaleaceae bacterium]
MGDMGKLIIRGNGREGDNESKIKTALFILGAILIVISFIIIGAISDYHSVSWYFLNMRRGIAIFNRWLLPTNFVRFAVAVLIIGGIAKEIAKMQPGYDSEIRCYENGVKGTSIAKDVFSLEYSDISSAYCSEEGSFRQQMVDINSHGKIYRVQTEKSAEIAAEINKRRKVAVNT